MPEPVCLQELEEVGQGLGLQEPLCWPEDQDLHWGSAETLRPVSPDWLL